MSLRTPGVVDAAGRVYARRARRQGEHHFVARAGVKGGSWAASRIRCEIAALKTTFVCGLGQGHESMVPSSIVGGLGRRSRRACHGQASHMGLPCAMCLPITNLLAPSSLHLQLASAPFLVNSGTNKLFLSS